MLVGLASPQAQRETAASPASVRLPWRLAMGLRGIIQEQYKPYSMLLKAEQTLARF
jgi:hypothetical protein